MKDSNSGERFGVEVTHLYYDREEADMLLGKRPNEVHGVMDMRNLIFTLNDLLVHKVSQAMKYSFQGRLFLLVRVGSPIFDLKDFELYADEILVPIANPFDQIWLLFRNQTTQAFSDLMQIQ